MAFATEIKTGDGSTRSWMISFPFIHSSHVKAVDDTGAALTISVAGSTVTLGDKEGTPVLDQKIKLFRETPRTPLVAFGAGTLNDAESQRIANLQALYVMQEALDQSGNALAANVYGRWDAQGERIINVADPLASQDAATALHVAEKIGELAAAIADGTHLDNILHTPERYGAVGDGITDDTAALQAMFNAGGNIYIPGKTYMATNIVISARVNVVCHPAAILKKREAGASNSILIEWGAGSAGSAWVGGTIDGNRSALEASYVWSYYDGWFGMVCNRPLVRIENVTFSNWSGKPFWFGGDYMIARNNVAEDCGCDALFAWRRFGGGAELVRPTDGSGCVGQYVDGLFAKRTDNNGKSGVFVHAIDIQGAKNGVYKNLQVIAQDGDTSSASSWASGITAEGCEGCLFEGWIYESPTTETLVHLAFSLLDNVNCQLINPMAFNIAGQALEMNACVDCHIRGGVLDGNYRASAAVGVGSDTSHGLTFYAGAWNTPQRNAKSLAGNSGCSITGTIIKRFTSGGNIRSYTIDMVGVQSYGHLKDGMNFLEQQLTTYFPGAVAPQLPRVSLTGCTFARNGRRGVNGASFDRLVMVGGTVNDNGQDTTATTDQRVGLTGSAGDLLSVTGSDMSDTQAWTVTDGISFQPGASDANNQLLVFNLAPGRFDVGQYIKLLNATGADLTAKVIDIDPNDVVTLQCAGATTLTNAAATNLTGTWTGSTTTLTGSGGAATTEITGQTMITYGTEWRRVVNVTNNNSITIDEAFSTPLSGATLQKLTVDVAGIPSQQYGARIFSTVTKIMLASNVYEGNVLGRMNISTPANCLPGCEFFRKATISPSATPANILTAIAKDHTLCGVAARVDATLSGAGVTDWNLLYTDSGGSTLASIATSIPLTQNEKRTGTVASVTKTADGALLRGTSTGGTWNAGSLTVEALFRVDAPAAMPNV